MLQLKSVWQKVLMSCHTKFGMTIWSIVILNNFRYDNWVWHMTWWLSKKQYDNAKKCHTTFHSVWQSTTLSCNLKFGMTIHAIVILSQNRYDNTCHCHTEQFRYDKEWHCHATGEWNLPGAVWQSKWLSYCAQNQYKLIFL